MSTEAKPGKASPTQGDLAQAFIEVRGALDGMRACLEHQPIDMLALAKGYASLARAMVAATRASGQTSSRFDAVAKALDLRTPKSALQRFLQP